MIRRLLKDRDNRVAAFTVAGAMSDDLVSDFHDAVDKAIANGETLESFQKDFDDIVDRYGWSYNGSRGWRSRVMPTGRMAKAVKAMPSTGAAAPDMSTRPSRKEPVPSPTM